MKFLVFRNAVFGALLVAVFLAASCGDGRDAATAEEGASAPASGDAPAQGQGVAPRYDFSRPETTAQLPGELREISGIASIGQNVVVAVQDEAGTLFTVDAASGRILNQLPFAKKGDFEDVAPAGGSLFVLRSDGTLFEIKEGWADRTANVEEHDTGLHKKCDAEGLALDAPRSRLLISCKEDAGKGVEDARTIWAYDFREKTLSEAPVFILPFADLEQQMGGGKKAKDFKPSALGIHPETGDLYVLSSVEKGIAVIDASGVLERFIELDAGLFPQPEGISFPAEGGILISNEGPGGAATLLRFGTAR